MNLKEQAKKYGVCDFKYAKRLKELGYPQLGLWWWVSVRKGEPELIEENQLGILECNSPHAYKRICVAPTVAELGEMLPTGYHTRKIKSEPEYINGHWTGKHKVIKWQGDKIGEFSGRFIANTETNARAKMKIYLLENKLEEKI